MYLDILSTRGGRIEMARREKGLTPGQFRQILSEKKGITIGSSHCSRIESNKVGLSLELLEAICELLDKGADWILFGKAPAVAPLAPIFTPEALQVASITDSLDNGFRSTLIDFANKIKSLSDEHRSLIEENASLLAVDENTDAATHTTDNGQQGAYIYFVEAIGAGRIKIGFSANPEKRIRGLTTSSAHELKTLKVIEGELAQERAIHRQFAHLRTHLEWFQDAPELREYIESL